MKPETQLAVVALGALGIGLVLGHASSKTAAPAPVSPAPVPVPIPGIINASSTNSLNNGWIYFLGLTTNVSPIDVQALRTTVMNAGFVDPDTKGLPNLNIGAGGIITGLTLFNGVTGTPVPDSTPALTWASVPGFPPPEGLITSV